MVRLGLRAQNSMIGEVFGRLTVRKYTVINGRGHYECECSCGNDTTVRRDSITSYKTRSCGCLSADTNKETHQKHGDSGTRLYTIYKKMYSRCYYPKNERFHRYGARGIKICDEWLDDYQTFKEWAIKNGYKGNLSIDRIDNDGDYRPDNCRWADVKTQLNNTSRNRYIQYKGETRTLTQWCEALGLNYDTTRGRLNRGISVEDVFDYKEDE